MMASVINVVRVAVLFAALAWAVDAEARQRQPLPDFQLTTAAGEAVSTEGAALTTGRKLLVYVRPNCRPCETLLKLVDPAENPSTPAAMVVVVGTGSEQLTAVQADYPHLQQAAWFADATGTVWKALQLSGTPVVLGLNNGVVEWRLRGVTPGDDEVKSILSTWAERPSKGGGGRD